MSLFLNRTIGLLLALLFMNFSLYAGNLTGDSLHDDSNFTELQEQIDSLKQELSKISQKQSWFEKNKEYLPRLSGYLQTGYNYNSFGEGLSTFMVKRLRLVIDGNIKKFSYKVQFEGFSGVNVGSRWEKQRLIQILDAFAQYSFKNSIQLRVGQFSSPMGYENYMVSPLTNVTIDYAAICSRMVLRNAVGYSYSDYGRDLGVMLLGNLFKANDGHDYLQYNIAVTNGHLPSVNDNNKSKDIICALTFWPTKLWNVKLAYNWGEYTPDSFSGNILMDPHPWNTVTGHKYVPLNRLIVGSWYNNPTGWYVRGEFGYQSSSKYGVKLVEEYGAYLVFAYQFPKWIPVIRGDFYRDIVNPKYPDNRLRGLVGCSFIANKHIKIQLNYLLSRYTHEAAYHANKNRLYSNELLLMGLFSF